MLPPTQLVPERSDEGLNMKTTIKSLSHKHVGKRVVGYLNAESLAAATKPRNGDFSGGMRRPFLLPLPIRFLSCLEQG